MRRSLLRPLFLRGVLALLTANLCAQGDFLYTNNNPGELANTVSAYSAAADETLTPVPGSPLATGAISAGNELLGSARIGAVGNFLLEGLENRTLLSFSAPFAFHLRRDARDVAVADFNGDGNQDLIVADDSGTMTVLLGNGDGSFRSAGSFQNPFGGIPLVVAGDFNGDGIPDLVAATRSGVTVFLGNSDGTFRSMGDIPLFQGVVPDRSSIAVADFNGDGKQDLVVASNEEGLPEPVLGLLGNGDGTFQSPVNLGFLSTFAVAGDINNDGKPDLVDLNSSGQAELRLGNGDGTFQNPIPFAPGIPLTVTDVTGDGIPDLVFRTPSGISERVGNGDSTFQDPVNVNLPANTPGTVLGVGDFNNNGLLDLVIRNQPFIGAGQALSVVLNNDAGSVVTAPAYAAGRFPGKVAAGDFAGHGLPDLVTLASDGMHLLVNNGDSTFRSEALASVQLSSLVAADFNGGGHLDLAGFSGGINSDLQVKVYLGNGDGTFQDPQIFDLGTEGLPNAELVVRDFNDDGRLDLAVLFRSRDQRHSFVTVLLGNGDGTFRGTETFQVANGGDTFPAGLVVGDFTGHGNLDLLVTRLDGTLVELAGNGDGTFQDPVTLHTSARPFGVAVGDLNGDGISDLIVTNAGGVGTIGSSVSVLLGNGDGTFQNPVTYQVGVDPSAVVLADFNGDGIPDVAVTNSLSNTVSVLLGNGNGTFQNAVDYLVGIDPRSLVAADLNGDGTLDLAVAGFHSGDVSVLLNRANGPGEPRPRPLQGSPQPSTPPPSMPSSPAPGRIR